MVATVCTAFTAVEEKSLKLPSTVCVPAGGRCKMKTCLKLLKIGGRTAACERKARNSTDRKSTRLNSSHVAISYAVFCLKKKKKTIYVTVPLFDADFLFLLNA